MKQVKIFTMMVAMLLMAITAHAGVNSKNTMPNITYPYVDNCNTQYCKIASITYGSTITMVKLVYNVAKVNFEDTKNIVMTDSNGKEYKLKFINGLKAGQEMEIEGKRFITLVFPKIKKTPTKANIEWADGNGFMFEGVDLTQSGPIQSVFWESVFFGAVDIQPAVLVWAGLGRESDKAFGKLLLLAKADVGVFLCRVNRLGGLAVDCAEDLIGLPLPWAKRHEVVERVFRERFNHETALLHLFKVRFPADGDIGMCVGLVEFVVFRMMLQEGGLFFCKGIPDRLAFLQTRLEVLSESVFGLILWQSLYLIIAIALDGFKMGVKGFFVGKEKAVSF